MVSDPIYSTGCGAGTVALKGALAVAGEAELHPPATLCERDFVWYVVGRVGVGAGDGEVAADAKGRHINLS